jgi:hypothetical protein
MEMLRTTDTHLPSLVDDCRDIQITHAEEENRVPTEKERKDREARAEHNRIKLVTKQKERKDKEERHRVGFELEYKEREEEGEQMIDEQYLTQQNKKTGEAEEAAAIAASRKVYTVGLVLSRAKDTTIHFELETTDDLELDMDEFSRQCRLGDLHSAKQFFWANLGQHVDHAYVFVQYAQMLMEMGDYKSVRALKMPYTLKESANKVHTKDLLWTNWKLVQLFSALHTEGVSAQKALLFAREATSMVMDNPEFGSMEV